MDMPREPEQCRSEPGAQEAQSLIGGILRGESIVRERIAACGIYTDSVEALLATQERGGAGAAGEAFFALKRDDPRIGALNVTVPPRIRKHWTAAELLTTTFPPPRWAVPNLVPEGLSILAGRPKVGKSLLAHQMAQALATGGSFLGRSVEERSVLYLALADGEQRLRERAAAQGCPPTDRIHYWLEWEALDQSGTDDLMRSVETEGFSCVVIDTLSRCIGKRDQNDGGEMTEVLGGLQRLAHARHVAILLIDHHRKAGAGDTSDPVRDILGSTAKAAVADAALGLYREPRTQHLALKAVGRDFEEQELRVELDAQTMTWQERGSSAEPAVNTFKGRVLDAIDYLVAQGQPPSGKRIAAHIRAAQSNVSTALRELCESGMVRREDGAGRETPYSRIGSESEGTS